MSDNILNGNTQTLRDILSKWEEHEKTVGEIELLSSKLRGIERDLEVMDKKTKDLTDSALKKTKDEILAKYNKSIVKEEDKLKKAKGNRDKALAKGKADRVEDETESLRSDNAKLKAELKEITRTNKLLPICRTRFFLAMFATKGISEIIIFILTFLLTTCVLPYLVFMILPSESTLALAGIYCAFWMVISFAYLFINNRMKIYKWEALKNIRMNKYKIMQNKKHILKIKTAIYKEDNDGKYDLNDFNTRIDEIETEIKNLNTQKNEALLEFENVTKAAITEEMAKPTKSEREVLVKMQEETKDILIKKEEVERSSKEALENYEKYLDKKLINKDSIMALIKIIEAGNAQSVSQAVAYYNENDK